MPIYFDLMKAFANQNYTGCMLVLFSLIKVSIRLKHLNILSFYCVCYFGGSSPYVFSPIIVISNIGNSSLSFYIMNKNYNYIKFVAYSSQEGNSGYMCYVSHMYVCKFKNISHGNFFSLKTCANT